MKPISRLASTSLLILAAVLTLTLCYPKPGVAGEKFLAKFKLTGQGELHLLVPEGWQADFRRPVNDQPPNIIFTPRTGNAFKLVITPMWDATGAPEFNSEARIRALLEKEMDIIAPSVKESRLELKPISGTGTQGFYFRASDKDLKPGEYEYLMRAGLGVGKLLLSVALVFHDQESPVVEETLALLRGASQK